MAGTEASILVGESRITIDINNENMVPAANGGVGYVPTNITYLLRLEYGAISIEHKCSHRIDSIEKNAIDVNTISYKHRI